MYVCGRLYVREIESVSMWESVCMWDRECMYVESVCT